MKNIHIILLIFISINLSAQDTTSGNDKYEWYESEDWYEEANKELKNLNFELAKKHIIKTIEAINIEDDEFLCESYWLRSKINFQLQQYKAVLKDCKKIKKMGVHVDEEFPCELEYIEGLANRNLNNLHKSKLHFDYVINSCDEYSSTITHTRLVSYDNKFPDYVYYERGLVLHAMGEYKKAIADFTSYLNYELPVLKNLREVKSTTDMKIKFFKKDVGTDIAGVLYMRGICYVALGKYKLGEKDVDESKKHIKDDDTDNLGRYYSTKSIIAFNKKDYQNCILLSDTALTYDFHFSNMYYLRYLSNKKLGVESCEDLRNACELDKDLCKSFNIYKYYIKNCKK